MSTPNAFHTLLRSAKQPSSSQKSSQAKRQRGGSQQADKYSVCPLCGGNIPRSFLDLHIETCLASSSQRPASQQQQQQQQQGTPLLPNPSHLNRPPHPTSAAQDASAPPLPLPTPSSSKSAAAATAAAPHTPTAALPGTSELSAHPPGPHQAASTPATAAAATPGTSATTATAAAGSNTIKAAAAAPAAAAGGLRPRNAFQVLQAAQRKQQPAAATFFLERKGDGSWAWHWWWKAEGPTPEQAALVPKWSAKTLLKPPKAATNTPAAPAAADDQDAATTTGSAAADGRSSSSKAGSSGQVMLTLQTDVAPGDGVEVSWQSPLLASNQPAAATPLHPPPAAPAAASASSTGNAVNAGGGGGVGGGAGRGPLRWRGGVSVLKSALQKNVRLGRVDEAVRVALVLLKDDPGELLRRLAVVVVEDATLHPATPALVWLMAAQAKGYVLGGTAVNLVLQVVQQLAAAPLRDFLPDPPIIGQLPGSFQGVDQVLQPPEALLVKALLLRASYGGMAGDVVMLKGYAAQWAARFAGKLGLPPNLGQAVQLGAVQVGAVQPGAVHPAAAASTSSPDTTAPAAAAATTSSTTAKSNGTSSSAKFDHGKASSSTTTTNTVTVGSTRTTTNTVTVGSTRTTTTTPTTSSSSSSPPWPCGTNSWSGFLSHCYQAADAAVTAARLPPPRVTLVGSLRPGDIPLTAVDFHVSDVAAHLLHDSRVQVVLQQLVAAGWGPDAEPEVLVRRVLWLCASSTNGRPWVQALQQQEYRRAEQQQQQEEDPQQQEQQQPPNQQQQLVLQHQQGQQEQQQQEQQQQQPNQEQQQQPNQQEEQQASQLQEQEPQQQKLQQQGQPSPNHQAAAAAALAPSSPLPPPPPPASPAAAPQPLPAATATTKQATAAAALQPQPPAQRAVVDLLLTWHLLERDEEQDAAQRDRLAPLWAAAQPLAAAYARGFIARR